MSNWRAWIQVALLLSAAFSAAFCAACSGGGGPNAPDPLPSPGGDEPPAEDPVPEPDGGAITLVGSGRVFDSLQQAVDAAVAGEVIELGRGTYRGDVTLRKSVTLRGRDGSGETILEGQNIRFDGDPTALPLRLEELTIRGGNTDSQGVPVLIDGVDLVVERCIFHDNKTEDRGGAVRVASDAEPNLVVFRDCVFFDNSSSGRAGAVEVSVGLNESMLSVHFERCRFLRNRGVSGGAVFVAAGSGSAHASVSFDACTFESNFAKDGGAVMAEAATGDAKIEIDLVNCLLFDNTATGSGAALHLIAITGASFIDAGIVHCTIADNISSNRLGAGAITVGMTSSSVLSRLRIHNSIVWANRIRDLAGSAFQRDVRYTLVGGEIAGEGNREADPLFTNSIDTPFSLALGSPALDAGSNDLAPPGLAIEFAGNPRLAGSAVDMGAFER